MKIKTLTFFFLSLLLTSCAFNNKFLQPTKVPENVTIINLRTAKDTFKVKVDSNNYQPTFLKESGDPLDLDYSINSVVFSSSSGNELNGWILKSNNQNPNYTLIHFHGNGGFLYNQYQGMLPLLEHGFQIFLFDYSGYGFSEGKATRENIIKDARSAVNYVKNQNEFKTKGTIIYGQSLGGNLGAIIAPEVGNEIDALVLEGSFSNHKDMAADVVGFAGRILVSQKHDALKAIKNYHKPLLVIHSEEDQIVPYKLGEKLYEAANQPKELYTIKECHICGPNYYGKEIAEKIKNMVR